MKKKLSNRFKYFKEKKMTVLVLLFLLLVNIAIIILGCLVLKALPENRGLSMGDALWESLRLILDPGGFLGSKLSAITTVVTSIIVLLGMVTFTGGIIGYVTNVITNKIDDSKQGIGELSLDEYTLILNWNKRALAIILDRYADKKRDNKNEYIVVLADVNNQELDADIEKALKIYKYTHVEINKDAPRVIVRSGDPTKPGELDNINYMNADSIFIMQPEGCQSPDYAVLKTFFSLVEQNNSVWEILSDDEKNTEILYNVDVIVETSDAATCKAIKCTEIRPYSYKGYVSNALNMDFTLGKILAQVAIMPEMGDAYKEIVGLSGAVLNDVMTPEEDCAFDDKITKYSYALPLIKKTDKNGETSILYVTSESLSYDEHCPYTKTEIGSVRVKNKKLKLSGNIGKFETHTIIICGINEKLEYILNAIKANNEVYPEHKCKVRLVVSEDLEEKATTFCELYHDILFEKPVIIDNYFDTDSVVKIIDKDFHSMLVLSNSAVEESQKDKNVFEFWLGLTLEMNTNQDLKMRLEHRTILEITDSDNATLVQSGSEKHLVICNEIASLFMAQMAEGETIYDNLLDMLCTEKDQDYDAQNTWNRNDCDLMAIKIKDLFETNEKVEFLGKRDLIVNVFHSTKGKIIPIGCIITGGTYFFTNGKNADKDIFGKYAPTIDDSVLVSGVDGGVYLGYLNEDQFGEELVSLGKYLIKDKLILDPDDYIIACVTQ